MEVHGGMLLLTWLHDLAVLIAHHGALLHLRGETVKSSQTQFRIRRDFSSESLSPLASTAVLLAKIDPGQNQAISLAEMSQREREEYLHMCRTSLCAVSSAPTGFWLTDCIRKKQHHQIFLAAAYVVASFFTNLCICILKAVC